MTDDGAVPRPDQASSASRGVVAAVLLVGLLATAIAVFAARQLEGDAYDRRFGVLADRATDVLDRRVQSQEASLTQLRNVVMLQHPIGREAFTALASLGLSEGLYAGARAVGYAQRVLPGEVASFEQSVRQDTSISPDGYPDFEVRPPPAGEPAYVVNYLVPLEGNEGAFGLNLAANPERRSAVDATRDRGDVVSTPPIRLVQDEGGDPSVILYQAVYDSGGVPMTAPARRRHFVGAVNVVVDIGALLGDVVAEQPEVALAVYDVGLTVDPAAPTADPGGLLFSSGADPPPGDVVATGVRRVVDLDVGDRRWRIVATPTEALPGPSALLSLVLAIAGLVITGLLGLTVYATARARDQAVTLAEEMTSDLRIAERRLRSLIASAPDATLVVGSDGTILVASDQVEPLLGYAPGDLVGRTVDILVPGGLRADHERHRETYVRAPQARRMGAQDDLVAVRADGRQIPVEVSLSPVPAASGGVDIIASLRDVSVQRDARAALERSLQAEREAVRELERTDLMRNTFLGTVSHELQTPLTAITGFTELLTKFGHDMDATEQRDLLSRIARNAGSLHTMIADLLDFTRLERGAVELRPLPLNLAAAVRSLVDRIGPILAGHGVDLRLEAVTAFADPNAVERILTNLLTNAARYAPTGSTITVSTRRQGDVAELAVADEGSGVAPGDRQAVFETFYRGGGAAELAHAGTGIGLSVVRELVTRQGGTVAVEDAPGGGARFVVRFPLESPSFP